MQLHRLPVSVLALALASLLSGAAPIRAGAPGVEDATTTWFRLDPAGFVPPRAPVAKPQGTGEGTDDQAAEPVDEDPLPLGVARWISSPLDPEDPTAGRRIELSLEWFDPLVDLLVAERHLPTETRLVWRERVGRAGRTVYASARSEDGHPLPVQVTCASGGPILRRTVPVERFGMLPLELVDRFRRGAAAPGLEAGERTLVAWPASGRSSVLTVSAEERPDGVRVLATTFEDGLAGPRFEFQGDRLIGFTWQAGGPTATPVSRDRYRRWIRLGKGEAHSQG